MIRKNLKRFKFVRSLRKDLLGICFLKRKLSILKIFLIKNLKKKIRNKYFFFRINFFERPFYHKRKTKYGKYFLKRKIFRLYYSFIKVRTLKKIVKKSLKSSNTINSFLYFMESRLDVLIYRLKLVSSIRMARQLILHGNVFVNDKKIKNFSYNLKENDYLYFDKTIVPFLKKRLLINILFKKFVNFRIPNYIEYSFKNLIFTFTRINLNDVKFLFHVDIFTFCSLLNFYKKCLF